MLTAENNVSISGISIAKSFDLKLKPKNRNNLKQIV